MCRVQTFGVTPDALRNMSCLYPRPSAAITRGRAGRPPTHEGLTERKRLSGVAARVSDPLPRLAAQLEQLDRARRQLGEAFLETLHGLQGSEDADEGERLDANPASRRSRVCLPMPARSASSACVRPVWMRWRAIRSPRIWAIAASVSSEAMCLIRREWRVEKPACLMSPYWANYSAYKLYFNSSY